MGRQSQRMDPAGFSQRYLQHMPRANVFDGGDGLNTAIHQWEFAAHGTGDLNTAYGTSFVADHYQANLKIDHVINTNHKIAFNGSYQNVANDYIPVSGPTVQWPGGYLSKTLRRPRVFTVNFTSTLTPALLNEARVGYRANWHYVWAPWEVPNEEDREVPLSFMLSGSNGVPIVYNPATIAVFRDKRRDADHRQFHLRYGMRPAGQLHAAVPVCGHADLVQREAHVQERCGYPYCIHEGLRNPNRSYPEGHWRRRARIRTQRFNE